MEQRANELAMQTGVDRAVIVRLLDKGAIK